METEAEVSLPTVTLLLSRTVSPRKRPRSPSSPYLAEGHGQGGDSSCVPLAVPVCIVLGKQGHSPVVLPARPRHFPICQKQKPPQRKKACLGKWRGERNLGNLAVSHSLESPSWGRRWPVCPLLAVPEHRVGAFGPNVDASLGSTKSSPALQPRLQPVSPLRSPPSPWRAGQSRSSPSHSRLFWRPAH